MATAKITLIGLSNYNSNLFHYMVLPDNIDRDLLIDCILMRCGEFEVLYPNPNYMQSAINVWSRKWYRTFEKWVNVLSMEYDPLSNYDRTETWTDTGSGNSTNQINGTNTETINDTNSETITNDTTTTHTSTGTATDNSTGSGNSESVNTVSAFDSSSYVPHDKNNSSTSTTNESISSTSANGTDEMENDVTRNGQNNTSRNGQNTSTSTENSSNTLSHTGRMYGNIGVTTSQQMLQSELDIATWNLYEHISDIFASEFCIMVY